MSSESLTPPPSTSSPFRPVSAGPSTLPDRPSTCVSHRLSELVKNGESSTSPSKRQIETTPLPTSPHRKRARGGTSTTLVNTTTHPVPNQDESIREGSLEVEYSRATSATTRKTPRQDTSEGGEHEDSVLFSEQIQPSGSTVVKGNMEDYIPQAEPLATMIPTEGTEGLENIEQLDDAEDAEEEGGGEEGEEGPPEEGDELDESHDRNDEEDDGGDEAAETPPWLLDPHIITREPVDKMSMVIEGKNGTAKRSTRRHIEEAVIVNEEFQEEADGPQSYHSGDTDDYEMHHRPVLERTAVKRDIRKMTESMATLVDHDTQELLFKVVDRLGEGTFSSVYLAHDRFFHYYDNYHWTGWRDEYTMDEIAEARSTMRVALKKILVTSSPARIENELHILESLRGCRNVSKLITAFREDDQVIIVMPYEQSDDFRHFYRHMDTRATQQYMRCLMRALKDTHRRGIVHRDVKPANFLYNYAEERGVLCDFGLAERYVPPKRSTCQHAPATLEHLHGTRTKTDDTSSVEQAVYDARKRAKAGEGKIGFSNDDKRPAIKTNRAGTRGFRAPEVLLKCPDQTVSIDIWSAGVILLSILTHKFPVFNSNDDTEALLEIAAIFGRSSMERCAMLHNRTIMTNISTVDKAPESLVPIILRLNPHIYTPPMSNPTPQDAEDHITKIDEAIDLCARMLRVDCTKRITAANSLRHAFLAPDEEDDEGWSDMESDEIIDPREGKCGHLHGYENGKHRAFFGDEIMDMHFGQGIPLTTESLCPEHEHWQQRTDNNVLAISEAFPYDEEEEVEEEDTAEATAVSRSQPAIGGINGKNGDPDRTLVERDTNVDIGRRLGLKK